MLVITAPDDYVGVSIAEVLTPDSVLNGIHCVPLSVIEDSIMEETETFTVELVAFLETQTVNGFLDPALEIGDGISTINISDSTGKIHCRYIFKGRQQHEGISFSIQTSDSS